MTKDEAAQLVMLKRSEAGKEYLAKMRSDYDRVIKAMLYAPVVDLPVFQGQARQMYEQLKVFDVAQEVYDGGNTQ